MLELTEEILAGLAEGESRNFVESVQRDLARDDPGLATDPGLSSRLWRAFQAARELGITQDAHLVQFLKIEAYAPAFYQKPAARAWFTRPVGTPDERFDDYVREIIWRAQHPDSLKGGMSDGSSTDPGSNGRSGGIGSRMVGYWNGLVGRSGGRRGG